VQIESAYDHARFVASPLANAYVDFQEITGLETLTGLEQLWLGQNKITALTGLSTLSNLRSLSIQANRITSLDGIEALPKLEELYISDNLLTSLEPLSNTPNLVILDVQNNPITSLKGVGPLKKLETFWATGCKLDSFEDMERELRDKKHLSEVYFEETPLQKAGPILYRNKVRLALPQVEKIDASKYFAWVMVQYKAANQTSLRPSMTIPMR